MDGFTNTVFSLMLGWLQMAVSMIWSGLTKQGGGFLQWIGEHWLLLALILLGIGLAADLMVYLFRWEPFRVWRSFFKRLRHTGTSEPESVSDSEEGAALPSSAAEYNDFEADSAVKQAGEYSSESGSPAEYDFAVQPSGGRIHLPLEEPEIPEISRWLQRESGEEAFLTAENSVGARTSGRVVPPDSPYRRPAPVHMKNEAPEAAGKDPEDPSLPSSGAEESITEKVVQHMIQPRRRRFRMTQLFSDPEEELYHYDPPRPVIDQNEAYMSPVYPNSSNQNRKDSP